jgi:hypothetical protein
MDLRQWWLDHKDWLTPKGTAWTALRARHWPRVKEISLDAWERSAQAREWISKHPNLAIAPAVIVAILVLLIVGQIAVAATLIGAWFALVRGISQGAADFRRRINETYSKAVSQLASDKMEERLGGIYTLESISKESPDDYWTVMETLTAFVRERSQRNYTEFKKSDERISPRARALWEKRGEPEGKDDEIWAEATQLGEPPATDIAAVLTVIKRRSDGSRERERANHWHFDFSQAVLKQAHLSGAHLEQAHLSGAHLEGVNLSGAHLQGADLSRAHLQEAYLGYADLEGAHLSGAHLQGANLLDAHLEGTHLWGTHLEGVNLSAAHLEGANLRKAHGDAATRLPAQVDRPAHWPAEEEPKLKTPPNTLLW